MGAGMFKVGDKFGVVDMALWIQVTITDFDRMIKIAVGHGVIIPLILRRGEIPGATIPILMGYILRRSSWGVRGCAPA